MAINFRGNAIPLDQPGIEDVTDLLRARLASAFQRYNTGFLPDLVVRAAQVYLVFLGFDPGPVDGEMGRLTRSALNEFQESIGAPITDDIDESQLRLLKERLFI